MLKRISKVRSLALLFFLLLSVMGSSQSMDFCEALSITRNATDFQHVDSLLLADHLSDRDIADLYTIRAKVGGERGHDFHSIQTSIDKAVGLMGESPRFAYYRYTILERERSTMEKTEI